MILGGTPQTVGKRLIIARSQVRGLPAPHYRAGQRLELVALLAPSSFPRHSSAARRHDVRAYAARRRSEGKSPRDPAGREAGDRPAAVQTPAALRPPRCGGRAGRLGSPPPTCVAVWGWPQAPKGGGVLFDADGSCCRKRAAGTACGASPGPSRPRPAGRVLAGKPAAPRQSQTSSTRSTPGGPAQHHRRSAARPATATGSPRTRTPPPDPGR
jgi:hypothetical protein